VVDAQPNLVHNTSMMKQKLTITVNAPRKRTRAHAVLFLDSRYKQRTVKSERHYDRKRQKEVDRKASWL
jgi:hypothetical protein